MPGRLRWYIVAVCVSGLLALVAVVPRIDLGRAGAVAGAIALSSPAS
jgi:hypothetical protein